MCSHQNFWQKFFDILHIVSYMKYYFLLIYYSIYYQYYLIYPIYNYYYTLSKTVKEIQIHSCQMHIQALYQIPAEANIEHMLQIYQFF